MAGFDPYYEWLGIPPKDQPPHAYRLLGLELFEANPKVIEAAAEQRTMLLRSRASGPQSEATQKLLNEVQRARILLLDDAKKAKYDAELRTQVRAAEQAANKALPMAQALPEPVPSIGPIVSPLDAARRPAPPAGNSLPVILSAAAAGVVVLGAIVFFLTRSPAEKPPPVAQNPPPVAPMPTPKPPVTPMKGPDETPFVPVAPVDPKPPEPTPPVDPVPAPIDPPPVEPKPEVAPAPAPPERPEADPRRAKPLPGEQEQALVSFREIFKDDLAKAKKPEQWQTLVTKVLQIASDSEGDAATHYVLLEQARQIAASAGLWEPTEQAIAVLSEKYQVDGKALRLESLEKALDGPVEAAARKTLIATGFEIFDSLLAEQQLDQAVQLSKVLTEPVRLARDKDLTAGLAARKKRGGEIFQAQQRATVARAALKANPDDAEANLELGKVLMIVGRPWEESLKHLAASSDPGWKAAAEKELAAPQESEQQVALADAWWDLSERAEAEMKPFVQGRAGAWYRTALPQLTGIAKAKAERRLAAFPAESIDPGSEQASASDPGPRRPAAKLIKEIYLDEMPEEFSRVYYGTPGGLGFEDDAKTTAILIAGKQPAHSLYTHPVGDGRMRAPAIVQYDVGGGFTTFSGAVGLNERADLLEPGSPVTCRVLGDNKVLWTSEPILRKGQVQEFSISVRGVKHLRLEAGSAGAASSCHVVWAMPKLRGGTKPLELVTDRLAGPRPMYLDDLVPVAWAAGHTGGLGYLGATTYPGEVGPFFTLSGRRVFHAIGTHARENAVSYVRYQLDGRFRSLKGTASLQEVPPGTPGYEGTLVFRIVGDQKTLWQSKPFRQSGGSEPFSISLAGVQALELQVQADHQAKGWAGWLEPQLEWARKPAPPPADAAITADEVVFWNTHNGDDRDRGAATANVLLYHGSDVVGQVPAVRLGWNGSRSVPTRVPLPKKSFNRLRIEVTAGTIYAGAGLNEIEVLSSGKNIAPQAIPTASDTYVNGSSPQGIFSAWMIQDGITQIPNQGSGYWILPDQNCGWIELEWRGAAKSAKHPVLGYPLGRHPATAHPFEGHWYLYFPGRITYTEAQRRCQAMGGYLACAETPREIQFTSALSRGQAVWLGGKKEPGGPWKWLNGSPFTATAWAGGEPNCVPAEAAFIEIVRGKEWNDSRDVDWNRGYICEWEL